MEIYEHNAVHGQVAPPQKNKPSIYAIISIVLAAVACALSAAALAVAVVLGGGESEKALGFEEIFGSVRPSSVEVWGGQEGSGVVYKVSGGKTYVITNNHVIAGVETALVRFTENGKKYEGAVLGYDSYHDIAVIELSGEYGAKPVTAGSKPNIGASVLAVGNNLGNGIAAFNGIVSRTSCLLKVTTESKTVPVYAVTCAVNGGMSGGGLFNDKGEIVGINTYRAATANGGEEQLYDMNYSVPFDIADKLARAIIADRPAGQVNKMEIRADAVTADEIEFIGLYFDAKFGEDGLEISYVYGAAADAFELTGGKPQIGDRVVKIGSLEVRPDTCVADIYSACLDYAHNPSLGSESLKAVLEREGETVTLTYNTKRFRF